MCDTSGLGFNLVRGHHPIIPVMLSDASLATAMADTLLAKLDYAIDAFQSVGHELKII